MTCHALNSQNTLIYSSNIFGKKILLFITQFLNPNDTIANFYIGHERNIMIIIFIFLFQVHFLFLMWVWWPMKKEKDSFPQLEHLSAF